MVLKQKRNRKECDKKEYEKHRRRQRMVFELTGAQFKAITKVT
jgi:hypothetical protein